MQDRVQTLAAVGWTSAHRCAGDAVGERGDFDTSDPVVGRAVQGDASASLTRLKSARDQGFHRFLPCPGRGSTGQIGGTAVPRLARKAKNQALFRDVNERIADMADKFDAAVETQSFICECSRIGCTDRIELTLSEYARVRDDPTTFVLVVGHEDTDHEELLVKTSGYLIVRNKPGLPAEIARETA